MSAAFTWKHAVRKDLAPDESLAVAQEDADELLAEWGAARGLMRLPGPVLVEKWNYGYWVGFGMYFTGRKLPAGLSRLQGFGCFGSETMRGAEERWPPLDREPQRPSAEELSEARKREKAALGNV